MRAYVIRRLLLVIPHAAHPEHARLPAGPLHSGGRHRQDAGPDRRGRWRVVHDRPRRRWNVGWDWTCRSPCSHGRWVADILLRGSLGKTLYTREAVEQQILARLPVTVELGVMAIVIGLLIALPVGVYSAIRQDTLADYAGRSAAIIGLSTPNFWLGTLVMIFPCDLVELGAAHASDYFHRRPAGTSRDVPDSQRDSGGRPRLQARCG